MNRVLLINQGQIPHYRIPVYDYLRRYLEPHGYTLIVLSEGLQGNRLDGIEFEHIQKKISTGSIIAAIGAYEIDTVIFWVNLKHPYLIPACLLAKLGLRKKIIYWGHGKDLLDRDNRIKNSLYFIQQALSDAIIIYAEHLLKYLPNILHAKTFVANNTLVPDRANFDRARKAAVLLKYGIFTQKNIICVGRIQKRKRIDRLIRAHELLDRPDIGLIIVGPDVDRVLPVRTRKNVYYVGPIYGKKKTELLCAADVFCIPGAIGLSIVDAFHCGLPVVTEAGDESPEIGYLKDGVNGFIVPQGDPAEMAAKLSYLLDNESARERFANEAKKEIDEHGHIEKMCSGFRDALDFVSRKPVVGKEASPTRILPVDPSNRRVHLRER